MDQYAAYRRPSLPAGHIEGRPYTLCPHDSGWLIEDTWPSIYFGREVVAAARRKVEALPWAKQLLESMRSEASLALELPPQFPIEQAGWRHDFYSRETGAHLLYEPDQSRSYLDPTTGQREHDAEQRKAWVLLTIERTYRMMRSLGLLYQLTGDERYAAWVAAGLRRAAEYSSHHEFRNGDALYFSSLYDSGMVLLLTNAYDLVRASPALTAADHTAIRAGIFDDRVPVLMKFLGTRRAHNMGCFAAAAIATAGEVLNQPEWVDFALTGTNGLHDQLTQGVPANEGGEIDGLWREGTTFYHFYSLCALVPLYEIGRRHNAVTDAMRQRFEAMFEAPVSLCDGQLRMPPLGDLGDPRTMHLGAYRHLYEYAAGTLNPPRFAPLLAAIYQQLDTPRTDIAALIYGPDELSAAIIPAASTLLPVARIGIFRGTAHCGTSNSDRKPVPFWLAFRAGKYGGGHDHPDRLSIFLHAHGVPISPDLGDAGYSVRDRHGNYFRSTLAHNTLFINEADQSAAASLDWRSHTSPPGARGEVEHEGVTLRRTVFFDPPYIVLLDEFEAAGEQRFGWIHHAYGDIEVHTAEEESQLINLSPLPTDGPWHNLKGRTTCLASRNISATWKVSDGLRLHLALCSDGAFEVTTAVTPGQPYADRLGALLLRAPGRAHRFAAVFEATPGKPTSLAIAFHGESAVRVSLTDGSERAYTWEQAR